MSSIYDETDFRDEDPGTALATRQIQPPRQMPAASGHVAELQVLAALAAGIIREPGEMIKRAQRTGDRMAEAGKAMYSFPAGGGRVEGPTVQMAEALAQEWGYLWTGVRIDSVEDDTVMLTAAVFDAATGSYLTRPHMATLPPAPGKFAAKAEQAARWESMQVQAAISKAIRTAILHALPGWYVQAAVEQARNYNRDKMLRGKSLPEAIADTVAHFGKLGVSVAQMETRVGAARALWTASDVVDFRVLAGEIKRGDATVAGSFQAASTGTARGHDLPPTSPPDGLRTTQPALPDNGAPVDELAGIRDDGRVKVEVDHGTAEIADAVLAAPTPAELAAAESAYQDRHGPPALAELRKRVTGASRGKDVPADTLPAYYAALMGD